ncbi:hypothetical protein QGP82_31315 [Leptothoe sp. LEGE 181152]|nr:hypothetical protein [Leptothoe sp. LEGE 181152]
MKLASVIVLLVLSIAQSARAELLFDRGLPFKHINNEAGEGRSNVRWAAGFDNQNFYGDDFSIGELGECYRIDHIRTWVVLGYREDDLPAEPGEVGDWFSEVRLLGGLPAAEPLSVLALGELTKGSSVINNSNIELSRVTYPNATGSNYHNFGRDITVWQLDFYDLNWVVEGGRRYNFSVQGMGRPLEKRDYLHGWYNHATSAQYRVSPQQGADNLMLVFSNEGEFVRVAEAEENWDKPSDINIQIFGEQLANSGSLAVDTPNALIEITNNLYQAELISERYHQWLLIEIEQGVTDRKSRLLAAVAGHALEENSGSYLPEQYVDVELSTEDSALAASILSRLPSFLMEFITEFEETYGVSTTDGLSAEKKEVFFRELEAAHGLNGEDFEALIVESVQGVFTESFGEHHGVGITNLGDVEEQLSQRLAELDSTGILDRSVYDHLQNKLSNYEILSTFELYERALDLTITLENLRPPYINERLDSLQQATILLPESQTNLLAALETEQITSEIEFFNYIDQATLLNMDEYPAHPQLYLPRVYEDVAQMLNGVDILENDFGTFQVVDAVEGASYFSGSGPFIAHGTLVSVDGEDIKEELDDVVPLWADDCRFHCELAISAKFSNRTYQQAGVYALLEEIKGDYDIYFEELSAFFNQVLRDQNSPYRLYTIGPSFDPRVFTDVRTLESNDNRLGFIALTEDQKANFFDRNHIAFSDSSLYSEQPGLRSEVVGKIVDSLETTGVLSHLNDEQIALGKGRLAQNYVTHSGQILSVFDDVIYNIFSLSGEGDGLYQELTLALADISRGAFQPSNFELVYDEVSQTERYSFDVNGNRYSKSFQADNEWASISDIVLFVATTTARENLEGRFYQLKDQYDTLSGYIFLSDAQYEALNDFGVFDIQSID